MRKSQQAARDILDYLEGLKGFDSLLDEIAAPEMVLIEKSITEIIGDTYGNEEG